MSKTKKYEYIICNNCIHYKQSNNRMVCMLCIKGTEFKEKLKVDRITFIYRIWRKIFRNQLDNLLIFTDNNSNGISSMPFRFNRFLTNFYNIDNDIEFFIRNGSSQVK